MIDLIYTTAKDMKQAREIQETLVKERLAACVKTGIKVKSLYWWKGRTEKANEVMIFIESRKANRKKIIKRIKEVHSYAVPTVVVLDVEDGYKPFLKWVDEI